MKKIKNNFPIHSLFIERSAHTMSALQVMTPQKFHVLVQRHWTVTGNKSIYRVGWLRKFYASNTIQNEVISGHSVALFGNAVR